MNAQPSIRLSIDEAWEFVASARTGIMTTLRRDGMPIAMPLWYVAHERSIYVSTRGKKLVRLRNDPRASFLVETGEKWAELKAVHFTGRVDLAPVDPDLSKLLSRMSEEKYRAFRTPASQMPESATRTYSTSMKWIRFIPDDRVLSWDNSRFQVGS
jgi:Pyridoxamine 5'-phosphate oxidase